jgi:hypothetical protein
MSVARRAVTMAAGAWLLAVLLACGISPVRRSSLVPALGPPPPPSFESRVGAQAQIAIPTYIESRSLGYDAVRGRDAEGLVVSRTMLDAALELSTRRVFGYRIVYRTIGGAGAVPVLDDGRPRALTPCGP